MSEQTVIYDCPVCDEEIEIGDTERELERVTCQGCLRNFVVDTDADDGRDATKLILCKHDSPDYYRDSIREALEWLDKNAPARAREVLIEALSK